MRLQAVGLEFSDLIPDDLETLPVVVVLAFAEDDPETLQDVDDVVNSSSFDACR